MTSHKSIEVTESMKRAGMDTLSEWCGGESESPSDFVTRLFLVMWQAGCISERSHTAPSNNDEAPEQSP